MGRKETFVSSKADNGVVVVAPTSRCAGRDALDKQRLASEGGSSKGETIS